ncbi:MAG: MFS transporter [Oligoflexia bacterium]|nr:MFS transporter [Oligoflexia bacterium]
MKKIKNNTGMLMLLFFLSGFAALIYQVVWHRALYQYFGVNIESVTIIVSIFMFGLGLGSLFGGYLSKKYPDKCFKLFILCEVLIGLFGCVSVYLMNTVADITVHNTLLQDTFTIYALLSIPTTLMGATLPLLSTHVFSQQKNVGKTVALLYFINTLGAGFACFFTVNFLFLYFGLKFSSFFAAMCNFLVVLLGVKLGSKINASDKVKTESSKKIKIFTKPFLLMLMLCAVTGFISMSQEIIWFRFFGYATGSQAKIFAVVLGTILFGIAFGSLVANKICEKNNYPLLNIIGKILIIAGFIFFFSIPIAAKLIEVVGTKFRLIPIGLLLLTSAAIAAAYGLIFPLINHYVVNTKVVVGRSISYLYFANIVGSTAGPLFTGFYLLQRFDINEVAAIFTAVSIALGWVLLLTTQTKTKSILVPTVISLVGFVGILNHKASYQLVFERTLGTLYPFVHKIENRGGILTVVKDPGHADIMYGDGGYDGRFSTEAVNDQNSLHRAFAMGVLHPTAKTALQIGLSTGSWTWVYSKFLSIQKIDVIEINDGYIDLIKQYPHTATILTDPKVNIIIDDGRRWMRKHREKKYDFIFMNTTFYYRSQISNLLSKEYFELAKSLLNEGGVFYVNATNSPDVPYTMAHVFKHVVKYANEIAGSDRPFVFSKDERKNALLNFIVDGKPLFTKDKEHMAIMQKIIKDTEFTDLGDTLRGPQPYLNLITDDNLASEFKTNRPFSKVWLKKKLNL